MSVGAIAPVGITKASASKVRNRKARTKAMTIDSTVSRTACDLTGAAVCVLLATILPDTSRDLVVLGFAMVRGRAADAVLVLRNCSRLTARGLATRMHSLRWLLSRSRFFAGRGEKKTKKPLGCGAKKSS